jgi:hypothetical protein
MCAPSSVTCYPPASNLAVDILCLLKMIAERREGLHGVIPEVRRGASPRVMKGGQTLRHKNYAGFTL